MKEKPKEKKIYHRLTLWLGVLVLGTIIGISIQFSRAWVEPSLNAPDGNIAAPINTGATKQVKQGDICTTVTGTEICLSSLANPTFLKCNLEGGSEVDIGSGIKVCKIPGNTCPTGWHRYNNFSQTDANTCVGTNGGCGGFTTVTSGSHQFSDVDPATETRTYYSTGSYQYIAYWAVVWVQTCCCWWPCDSSYSTPVYVTGCNSTPNTCLSTVRSVGCVAD